MEANLTSGNMEVFLTPMEIVRKGITSTEENSKFRNFNIHDSNMEVNFTPMEEIWKYLLFSFYSQWSQIWKRLHGKNHIQWNQ